MLGFTCFYSCCLWDIVQSWTQAAAVRHASSHAEFRVYQDARLYPITPLRRPFRWLTMGILGPRSLSWLGALQLMEAGCRQLMACLEAPSLCTDAHSGRATSALARTSKKISLASATKTIGAIEEISCTKIYTKIQAKPRNLAKRLAELGHSEPVSLHQAVIDKAERVEGLHGIRLLGVHRRPSRGVAGNIGSLHWHDSRSIHRP